jgi:hypothetical protein
MTGYDIDGVLHGGGVIPEGDYVVVSGRTFAEYDDTVRDLAQRAPVYIRGVGAYGDRHHAGAFKALMVEVLGLDEFHEDDPLQAEYIRQRNPSCVVVMA